MVGDKILVAPHEVRQRVGRVLILTVCESNAQRYHRRQEINSNVVGHRALSRAYRTKSKPLSQPRAKPEVYLDNATENAIFGYFFGEKKVTCAHETRSTNAISLRARNKYAPKIKAG